MRATITTVLDPILGELDTSVKLGKRFSRGRRRICHPLLKPKRYSLSQNISLGKASGCSARGGFLTRHDEDIREPLVRRQGTHVSMRMARRSWCELPMKYMHRDQMY